MKGMLGFGVVPAIVGQHFFFYWFCFSTATLPSPAPLSPAKYVVPPGTRKRREGSSSYRCCSCWQLSWRTIAPQAKTSTRWMTIFFVCSFVFSFFCAYLVGESIALERRVLYGIRMTAAVLICSSWFVSLLPAPVIFLQRVWDI